MSDSEIVPPLRRAIKIVGTQAVLASIIGTKQQTISDLLRSEKLVPAEWCIPIDLATQDAGERVACSELRPDLWPVSFNPKVEKVRMEAA